MNRDAQPGDWGFDVVRAWSSDPLAFAREPGLQVKMRLFTTEGTGEPMDRLLEACFALRYAFQAYAGAWR